MLLCHFLKDKNDTKQKHISAIAITEDNTPGVKYNTKKKTILFLSSSAVVLYSLAKNKPKHIKLINISAPENK